MSRTRTVLLDVDGTLVDSNYHHALAWYRAFRSLGETFPVWRIHRLIGMGGDQLVPALGGRTWRPGSATRRGSAGCGRPTR
jgi:beta-phosphoglucomutase-like phosphatase (HAD superfamily)